MTSSAGRGCSPGCGTVWLVFLSSLAIPWFIASSGAVGAAIITFGVLLLSCFVLGYHIPAGGRSFQFCIHTRKFPTGPEGLEFNNEMPGSKVVEHLKQLLQGRIDRADESIQEDWGWGFYCEKDRCRIWVGASFAIAIDGVQPDTAEWVISTTHERMWWISQWLRSFRGLRVARELHHFLLAAFKKDTEVEIAWAEDSDLPPGNSPG